KDWLIRVFSDARSEEDSQCPEVSGYALNHAVIIYASRPVLRTFISYIRFTLIHFFQLRGY
ncbi:MAG: hypothetical protein IKA19_09530, partial [Muribaculaceae bacterium]|nr:hypothetical protein [Muribaculaceae bacterium]